MPSKLINLISKYLKDSPQIQSIDDEQDFVTSNLQSLALQIVTAYNNNPSKIALAFPSLYDVQLFSDYLLDFLPSEKVAIYPKDEILRLGNTSSSKEMARERLRTLYRIRNSENIIVLFNSAASLSPIDSPELFDDVAFDIEVGEVIDRDELVSKLSNEGYNRVNWVNSGFEYAVRGTILDVFSPSYDLPIRIELDDDKIDSIRLFSPLTLKSETQLTKATILPASERPVNQETAIKAKELMLKDLKSIKDSNLKLEIDEKIKDIEISSENTIKSGIVLDADESLFPYYDVKKGTIINYLKQYKIFMVSPKQFYQSQNSFKEDEISYFADNKTKGLSLPLESIYELPSVANREAHYKKIELNSLESNDGICEIPVTNSNLNQSGILLEDAKRLSLKTYACLDDKTIPTYINYLNESSYPYSMDSSIENGVTILSSSLTKGFRIKDKAEFLSSAEIFGVALKKSRFLTRYKDFKPIKKYSDLVKGDYVVEEKNGIGIFEGIQQYKGLDYITIEYADQATLMVPIKNFNNIRKYAGSEANRPSLDTIGGATWARKKAKIKSRMTFLADKLLNIYSERERIKGIAYKSDPVEEGNFAKDFPYPLTLSQNKAWSDISADMEKPHPMDRLIAGDVGFGKTELAFKAIFKAVMNGYQAALLCPTTVLSRQHFEVAKQRFKDTGVRIGILNRFNSSKEEKQTLEDLSAGKIDLVIGTHRLLSQDVKFKELGLLVVDEEQKFGVAQKERIKEIAKNLDVLSLSATPIPRTLQMSLLTIRPMSILEDAPQNRLPVKTYVCQENDGLIKEVISRELARDGQVYFLHNRIDTIYSVAGKLKKMFPNITVGVAHGSMDANQIADVMNDFYDKKIEILVSTSIIESGLDVPNVNTIIVEDSQNFGLAQLYQIKGRVGRSNRLAYAYLLYRDYDRISDEGRKRLKALKDFTELGSGYKIAQQDLAIRGSGNILGSEQAGFVDSLGYETYTKLLKEVIEQKRANEKGIKLAQKKPTKFNLSFTLDAHIPTDYASSTDRVNLYREIQDCTEENELNDLIKTIRDSYGPYPLEVRNLFKKRLIEITLNNDELFIGFEELMESFKLTLTEAFSNVKNVKEKLEMYLSPIRDSIKEIRFIDRHFILGLRRTSSYLDDLFYLVRVLSNIFDGHNRPTKLIDDEED